jgi:hypothetical protein
MLTNWTGYEQRDRMIKDNESSIFNTHGDFSFHLIFQTGSGDSPNYWTCIGISFEVQRPERETDRTYLSIAEIKNGRSPTSSPPHVFLAWPNVRQ